MEPCIGIYLRVSLEDQQKGDDRESDSIENQRQLIRRYIMEDDTLKGLPSEEFADDGFTGTNFERPAVQKMLELAKSGKISCIIVKDLSRFGRNYLDVGDWLEHLFPFLGVRFIAVNDGYDSSRYQGTNAGIEIAFKNILHDYYSRDLSVKVRTAQRSRMRTGRYVNTPPYGYQRDPADKHHLVVDPDTAPVVRKIFEMVMEGHSTSEVASYLNERNIPTPLQAKGRKRKAGMLCEKPLMWSHAAVLNILSNLKYTGAMVNHTRENRKLRDKVQAKLPEEQWVIHEGMHEAIVTKEEFNRAGQMIRKVKKHGRKPADLTDCVYYCGHCGRRLRKTYGSSTYLTCQTFKYMPEAKCRTTRWILPEIEKVVLEAFKAQLLFLSDVPKKKRESGRPAAAYPEKIEKMERQLEKCRNKKLELYGEYRQGRLSKDEFLSEKAGTAGEEEKLKQEIDRLRQAYENDQEDQARQKEQEAAADQYGSYLRLPDEELIRFMYQGIERVLVYNDRNIEISWKFRDVLNELVSPGIVDFSPKTGYIMGEKKGVMGNAGI